MRIAPLADVKARLSAYLDECGAEGPVVITRNGKAAAVLLVPYDDDDLGASHAGAFAALSSIARPLPAKHQGGERLIRESVLVGRSQTSTRTKGRRSEGPPNQALKQRRRCPG
jgi:prevent-host-death family protein